MKKSAGEKGTMLMEFVLIMPILLFLILGLIQLSLIWRAKFLTSYAAYSGARAAIVYPPGDQETAAYAAACLALSDVLHPEFRKSSVSVTVDTAPGGNRNGGVPLPAVKASVVYRYPLIVPYVNTFFALAGAGEEPQWTLAGATAPVSRTGRGAAASSSGGAGSTLAVKASCTLPCPWSTASFPGASAEDKQNWSNVQP